MIKEDINLVSRKSVAISATDCSDRLAHLQKTVKGSWTLDEDNLIMKCYDKFGRNWHIIAKKIHGRTGK